MTKFYMATLCKVRMNHLEELGISESESSAHIQIILGIFLSLDCIRSRAKSKLRVPLER